MLELLALEKKNKSLATYGDNKVIDEEDDVVEDDVDLENDHYSAENFYDDDDSDRTSDSPTSVPIEKRLRFRRSKGYY